MLPGLLWHRDTTDKDLVWVAASKQILSACIRFVTSAGVCLSFASYTVKSKSHVLRWKFVTPLRLLATPLTRVESSNGNSYSLATLFVLSRPRHSPICWQSSFWCQVLFLLWTIRFALTLKLVSSPYLVLFLSRLPKRSRSFFFFFPFLFFEGPFFQSFFFVFRCCFHSHTSCFTSYPPLPLATLSLKAFWLPQISFLPFPSKDVFSSQTNCSSFVLFFAFASSLLASPLPSQ